MLWPWRKTAASVVEQPWVRAAEEEEESNRQKHYYTTRHVASHLPPAGGTDSRQPVLGGVWVESLSEVLNSALLRQRPALRCLLSLSPSVSCSC
ncbi:hypothetical protein AOLI_G00315510 [Acnodon oligacanthus]